MTRELKEHVNVRQIPGESRRRWFSSDDFDLIVWFADDRSFNGFELCYDKSDNEHSIAWSEAAGFRHMAVDEGEGRPGKHKSTPVLIADGHFDAGRVYLAFRNASHSLPDDIAKYVLKALEQYLEGSADRVHSD